MTGNGRTEGDEEENAMDTGRHHKTDLYTGIGEPRSADVSITVITALILLVVLLFVAVV